MKKMTNTLIVLLVLSTSLSIANERIIYTNVSENSVKKQETKTFVWGLAGLFTALMGAKDIIGSFARISVDTSKVNATLNKQAFETLDNELANKLKSANLTDREIKMINNSTDTTKKAAFAYMKQLIKESHYYETRAQFYRGLVFSLLSAYSFQKSYENYNMLYDLKAQMNAQINPNGSITSKASITVSI
ncbi:hypothetical protein Noda2021_11260 [Candidatus Dependentiae bacterium Noda2021]|nr:hypothetical protein Noda2021_11260 [Candidatus Dependentiae bacterium Noda2021]